MKTDLLLALLAEAKKQGLTATNMSTRTGIAYASCRRLLRGEARAPTLGTVMALAQVLECRLVIGIGAEP